MEAATVKNFFRDPVSAMRDTVAALSRPDTPDRLLMLFPFLLGLALRLPFLVWPEAIYNDSIVYIDAAKGILEGRWADTIVPPVYSLLMIAVDLATHDLEKAGIIVSLVFGCLLFLPLFYLGKELYGPQAGFLASLLGAVQPCLYKYSGAVLTESLYYFLVASLGFLALRAYRTGATLWCVFFGFASAMAYLVKPEAIGFLLVFAAWVILISPPAGRRPLLARLAMVLAALLCFAAFSSPYILLLRKETGRWELSKKVSVEIAPGAEDGFPREKAAQSRRVSLSSWVRHPVSVAKVSLSGAFVSFYKFQQAFNPLLFLFALYGFARHRESRYPWHQNFLLLAFILFFFALVFPYFKISARYASQMIPLTLPWAAYGLMGMTQRFFPVRKGRVWGRATAGFLLVIVVGLFIQGVLEGDRRHRQLQREVGLWLRSNGARGAKVVSSRVHEAFYARMELISYPEGDIERAVEAGAGPDRYIVVDEEMELRHPHLVQKMESQGIERLRCWMKGDDRICVFRNIRPARIPRVAGNDGSFS